MNMQEPVLRVGICCVRNPEVRFGGRFLRRDIASDGTVTACAEIDEHSDLPVRFEAGDRVRFIPAEAGCWFELNDITIGIGFHWERRESQRFRGVLSIEPYPEDGEMLMVINEVSLEEYLKSVISSEMSASASLNYLKTHVIVSRSWLIRQLANRRKTDYGPSCEVRRYRRLDGRPVTEITRWYDREEHQYFDVCADDHCQRYQGLARQTSGKVAEAVEATAGVVLTFGGEVCDARFSKCCGGITERFENCWEEDAKPYLRHVADADDKGVFCDTRDMALLRRVLNNFDYEDPDFFEWHAEYAPDVLGELVSRKSGVTIGVVEDLIPLETTGAGRIIRLEIRGSEGVLIVGKELEIRSCLSETHLRSSIFTVGRADNGDFILHGRGWGHGVGMCQIGAAVMDSRGYTAEQILAHYFPMAQLEKVY